MCVPVRGWRSGRSEYYRNLGAAHIHVHVCNKKTVPTSITDYLSHMPFVRSLLFLPVRSISPPIHSLSHFTHQQL